MPLYLHALAGVGALIAAAFFIGFLVIAEIIDFQSNSSLIVWGIILVVLAIPMSMARQRLTTARSEAVS